MRARIAGHEFVPETRQRRVTRVDLVLQLRHYTLEYQAAAFGAVQRLQTQRVALALGVKIAHRGSVGAFTRHQRLATFEGGVVARARRGITCIQRLLQLRGAHGRGVQQFARLCELTLALSHALPHGAESDLVLCAELGAPLCGCSHEFLLVGAQLHKLARIASAALLGRRQQRAHFLQRVLQLPLTLVLRGEHVLRVAQTRVHGLQARFQLRARLVGARSGYPGARRVRHDRGFRVVCVGIRGGLGRLECGVEHRQLCGTVQVSGQWCRGGRHDCGSLAPRAGQPGAPEKFCERSPGNRGPSVLRPCPHGWFRSVDTP